MLSIRLSKEEYILSMIEYHYEGGSYGGLQRLDVGAAGRLEGRTLALGQRLSSIHDTVTPVNKVTSLLRYSIAHSLTYPIKFAIHPAYKSDQLGHPLPAFHRISSCLHASAQLPQYAKVSVVKIPNNRTLGKGSQSLWWRSRVLVCAQKGRTAGGARAERITS